MRCALVAVAALAALGSCAAGGGVSHASDAATYPREPVHVHDGCATCETVARIAGQIAREHVPPLDASRRRAHLHQAHLGGVAHQAAGLPPACEQGAAARAPAA